MERHHQLEYHLRELKLSGMGRQPCSSRAGLFCALLPTAGIPLLPSDILNLAAASLPLAGKAACLRAYL